MSVLFLDRIDNLVLFSLAFDICIIKEKSLRYLMGDTNFDDKMYFVIINDTHRQQSVFSLSFCTFEYELGLWEVPSSQLTLRQNLQEAHEHDVMR